MGAEERRQQPWAGAQPPDSMDPEVSRRVGAILDAAEREVAEIRNRARDEALRYMEYARRRADGLVAERQLRISELSGELLQRAEHLLAQVESAEPLREALDEVVRQLTETAEELSRHAGDSGQFVPPRFGEAPAETPEPAPGPTPVPDPSPQPGPPSPPTPIPEPPPTPPAAEAPSAPPAWPEVVHPASPEPPPAPPPAPEPAPEPPPAPEPAPEPPPGSGAQLLAVQMAAAGSTRSQVESYLRDSLGVQDPVATVDQVFGPGSAPDSTVPWAKAR